MINKSSYAYYFQSANYRFFETPSSFGVLDSKEITDTEQFAATVFFIRKQPSSMQFLANWQAPYYKNFSLIDDSISKIPNLKGFRDHRHDQSIYSILCKKEGVEELVSTEFFHNEWSSTEMANQPILAKRDKQLPFSDKLQKAIHRHFVMFINRLKGYFN